MESKNVKIVDEHNIDRDASVICGFTVGDKKYVLYSIGRDEESDNLFVSKVVDNIDKTSNMVNIEDAAEKTKIGELVKELVTHSLKNENDTSGSEVELSNEKIKIVDVLFNKEQNIDVTKTYVSTVKKAVTKVSEKFYKVAAPVAPTEPSIFETLPVEEASKVEVTMPELNLEAPKEEPASEPVQPEPAPVAPTPGPELELPKELLEPTPEPAPVAPTVVEPVPEPVQPAPVEIPTIVEPVATPAVEPVTAPVVEPTPVEAPAPVVPEPAPAVLPVEPVKEETPAPVPTPTEEPKLFFDGADESNLNKALGEVSEEKVVAAPQDGVESLREFGVDEPKVDQSPVEENPTPDGQKGGFANNKFFMAIAILFFLAACVFLGYEAFQYFQLR